MRSPVEIVRSFRDLRVVVLGDAMLDTYRTGSASRLCSEGPVPVVYQTSSEHAPGGAANTAANVAALGAEVRFVGLVGPDHAGGTLRKTLRAQGVRTDWLVEDPNVVTLCKERVIADGQYVVRVDTGDAERCSPEGLRRLIASLGAAFDGCDAVIVSDYGYGATPDAMLNALKGLRSDRPVPLVLDSKQLRRFARIAATVITPNHHEARAFVTSQGATPQSNDEIAHGLLDAIDCQFVAMTMAADGVLLAGRDGMTLRIPAHQVAHPADVGAGDSFTAALALALAAGAEVEEAARIGIDAAGVAVAKPRTAIVEQQELLQRVALRGMTGDVDEARAQADQLAEKLLVDRLTGKRIVFTNGVFDILHAGHVAFLREARALGDLLVVGVNSDASVAGMPGKRRPLNGERDRLALISALESVDHALLFDEPTPAEMIRRLRPHVHVKGGDYASELLPEAEAVVEVGGQVVILPLPGEATERAMIHRILSIAATGELGAIHD